MEKNRIWDKKCQEIDTYNGGRQCTEAWKFIKNVRNSGKEKVYIPIIQQQQWVKHYQEFLTETRSKYLDNTHSIPSIKILGERIEVEEDMVVKAIMKLKNGKSCGPEGIYAELLKYGTKKLFMMLTDIFNQCINGQEIPNEWKVAYISSIHKKGSKQSATIIEESL